MSRLQRGLKEPLRVTRGLSTGSNSPPRVIASNANFIANFDDAFGRLTIEEGASMITSGTIQNTRTSNTMRVALNSSTSGRMVMGSSPSGLRTDVIKTTPKTLDGTVQVNFPLYKYHSTRPAAVRVYIRSEVEANDWVDKLKGPLGFDLEWRFFYFRGAPERKTAVLQLCDENTILVIQLSAMKGFPERLKAVIESEDVIKMGINILNDGRKLTRDFPSVSPHCLLELTHMANLVDSERVTTKRMISLQKIVEMYTGYTLSKGPVRTSNWEALNLSEAQLEYAANDAHSALMVYLELRRIADSKGMTIKPMTSSTDNSVPGMAVQFMENKPVSTRTREIAAKRAPRLAPSISTSETVTETKKVVQPTFRSLGSSYVTSFDLPNNTKTKSIVRKKPTGQQLRAYTLWHEQDIPLSDICATLRSAEDPLKMGSVITYIVEALKADNSLPFSALKLQELVEQDWGSWQRYGWWVASKQKPDRK